MNKDKGDILRGNPLTIQLSEDIINSFTEVEYAKFIYSRFAKLRDQLGIDIERFKELFDQYLAYERQKVLSNLTQLKAVFDQLPESEKKRIAKELGLQ